MADCEFLDFSRRTEALAMSALGDAIENMASAVMEAFGKVVGSLGAVWVPIGTPNLTGLAEVRRSRPTHPRPIRPMPPFSANAMGSRARSLQQH
ncbi:MAG: hypothetical protein ACK5KU_04045 [Beutenbergiaceae bacterium]